MDYSFINRPNLKIYPADSAYVLLRNELAYKHWFFCLVNLIFMLIALYASVVLAFIARNIYLSKKKSPSVHGKNAKSKLAQVADKSVAVNELV
jgi:hypothetical protein